MGARRRGSCARQRSRALDPFALTRGMHRFPQIASPLHIEPEIRIIAEHAGEATESCVLLREGIDVKFAFIAKHRGIRSSEWLCAALVLAGRLYAG